MPNKKTDLIPRNVRTQLLVLAAALGVLFYPTLKGMYDIWMQDSNNSHGMLVPFIVGYLVWQKLKSRDGEWHDLGQTLKDRDRFKVVGLGGLILTLMFYVVSVVMDIAVFKNMSFVLSVQCLALYLGGWGLVKEFFFPLFFLWFMVPVPVTVYGRVALPMQLLATKLTVGVLGLTPLPISADGNIIRVGGEMLTVAEACSGLRSLLTFVMISFLFAYLSKVKMWKRVTMVVLSVPIAICGNIVRLVFTAFVAYIYGSRVASGFIHDVSGYVMFVVAFGVFLWLSKVMEESERQSIDVGR